MSRCFFKAMLLALVPLLFIIFVGLNFFHIIPFAHISIHTFVILLIIFFIFLLFVPHNAYVSECKMRAHLNILQNEIEKQLDLTKLEIGSKSKSILDIEEFLGEYFSDIRNDNFAKIAATTFPMLGILGTFIAIAISMPNFTISNVNELNTQISKLLSGVGTAFYASIFGIFLSLWWIFFERFGLSKINALAHSLKKVYAKDIWSQRELLAFKYNQKMLFENEFIKSLKEIFNLDFIKEINKEHLQTYQNLIEKSKEGLLNIEKELSKSAKEISQSTKALAANKEALEATRLLSENIKEFNESAKNLLILLKSFDEGLDEALKKVDKELATSVYHIKELVETVKEIK